MKRIFGIIMAAVLLVSYTPVFAHEAAELGREIVILVDASNSMNGNDPGKLAPDGLKQLVGSLPSDYSVGLVVFNSGIVAEHPISDNRVAVMSALDRTTYSGYTDAGAGLRAAVDLFSTDSSRSQAIVFISDGEIVMESDEETMRSTSMFETACSEAADRGIPVYTVGIGDEFREHENSIVDIADSTGGALYELASARGVTEAVNSILFQDLGVRKVSVGMAQAVTTQRTFTVPLPVGGADVARILLTSDMAVPMEDITVNFNGADVDIFQGQKFSLVSIDRPTSESISIELTAGASSTIRAELMVEQAAAIHHAVAYVDTQERGGDGPAVSREAVVTLWLENSQGANLLQDSYYAGKLVPMTWDGRTQQLAVADGILRFSCPVEEDQTAVVSLDLDSLDINLLGVSPITISLVRAPEIESFNYLPLILILAVLCLAIAAVILRARSRRKRQPQPPAPSFESKHSFTGRLNLYVTKTADDIDIQPMHYELYRIDKGELSLYEILYQCKIPNPWPGSEKIYLVPGKNRTLDVVNESDCTILVGHDLLIKKRTHRMAYGEKLHVTFEDELTAMEVHYRNVQPSERR